MVSRVCTLLRLIATQRKDLISCSFYFLLELKTFKLGSISVLSKESFGPKNLRNGALTFKLLDDWPLTSCLDSPFLFHFFFLKKNQWYDAYLLIFVQNITSLSHENNQLLLKWVVLLFRYSKIYVCHSTLHLLVHDKSAGKICLIREDNEINLFYYRYTRLKGNCHLLELGSIHTQ